MNSMFQTVVLVLCAATGLSCQILNAEEKPDSSVLVTALDNKSIAQTCGFETVKRVDPASGGPALNSLPSGFRAWECVPSVILNDGIDSFRLEVDVNGTVGNVLWAGLSGTSVATESGTNTVWLRDDGLAEDRVAGDGVYTSERCRYRTSYQFPGTQNNSTNTPAGIYFERAGQLTVIETNGAQNTFLIAPSFAILNTNVAPVETVILETNIQISPYLVNLITTNREGQLDLRHSSTPTPLTSTFYHAFPDAFDFLLFFTSDHIEVLPQSASANFISGTFYPVVNKTQGIGEPVFDFSGTYGSTGRLLGLALLDTMERGIGTSVNVTHELSHQWSAYLSSSLGITTGDGHWHRNSGMDSVLGGLYKPTASTNNSFLRTCNPSDYFDATPLDKYLMGLVSTSAVPPVVLSSNILAINCGAAITNLAAPVTISNIVALHGAREPSWTNSQKQFRLGFVCCSLGRLLTATEMKFYNLLAAHYVKNQPGAHPNLSEGWVSVTSFFGEGTTWSADILELLRPRLTSISGAGSNLTVAGSGYPGARYNLFVSPDGKSWTNRVATATEPTEY
jgi:hypothetical protein